jgi:hypothetical protein
VPNFTAAAQQIVGKPDSYAFGRSRAALDAWPLVLPEGRGSQPGWRSTLSAIWRAAAAKPVDGVCLILPRSLILLLLRSRSSASQTPTPSAEAERRSMHGF